MYTSLHEDIIKKHYVQTKLVLYYIFKTFKKISNHIFWK